MILFIRVFQLLSYCLTQFPFRNPAEPFQDLMHLSLVGIGHMCFGFFHPHVEVVVSVLVLLLPTVEFVCVQGAQECRTCLPR